MSPLPEGTLPDVVMYEDPETYSLNFLYPEEPDTSAFTYEDPETYSLASQTQGETYTTAFALEDPEMHSPASRHPQGNHASVVASEDLKTRSQILRNPEASRPATVAHEDLAPCSFKVQPPIRETQYKIECMPLQESPNPKARLETELRKLAANLRPHPTVPGDSTMQEPMPAVFDDTVGVLLPPKHCAFRGCDWQLDWSEAESCQQYERAREMKVVQHAVEVEDAIGCLPRMHTQQECVAAVYNEAIAIKVREGAPLASYSIDRKCLRKGVVATAGYNVQALMCFFCACIHPHRARDPAFSIRWHSIVEIFGKYSIEEAEEQFGVEAYLEKYGRDPLVYYDLRRHRTEFEDWEKRVPLCGN